jgi:hypothetical protein
MSDEEKRHEKLRRIMITHFSQKSEIEVTTETQKIPLVAANVSKSTRSFSKGQVLYIYDGYWGMAERVKVVGRFRRKHNWIKGVIPIKNLGNFRPDEVYKPVVIGKLDGEIIHENLFSLFLDLPEWEINRKELEKESTFAAKILQLFKRIFN